MEVTTMDSDDILKGRILSRREILGLFGAAGAAFLVACSGDDEPAQPTSSETGSGAVAEGSPAVSGGNASVSEAATATSVPSCVVLPDLTEGPYFVDTQLDRSDIRAD